MSFSELARLNHMRLRLQKMDRDTFFGREEIMEWIMEEEHEEFGEEWRKFGRYGNVMNPKAFYRGLRRLKSECHFSREEMTELYEWTKGQGETYGNPDQIVAAILWKRWIEENYKEVEKPKVPRIKKKK